MKVIDLTTTCRVAGAVLLVFSAPLSVRADFPSSVMAQNPVAYWRLNETAASPAPQTVADSAGLGALGIGYADLGPTQGEPGIVGRSVRFVNNGGGAAQCGTRIDIPFSPTLNPNPPFSIEFWANPASLQDTTGLCPVSSMNPLFFAANRSGWIFYCSSAGKWQFRVGGENSYVAVAGPASAGLASVGVWQHVVGVFDGANATLYVNGQQVATAAAAAGFLANNSVALRIGGTSFTGNLGFEPTGNRGWDGWVDEVALYARALDPSTIAAHFSAATTNNAGYHAQILGDTPLGYWGLDEPAYVQPDPSTYPGVVNSGSAAADANGTNMLGVLADQPGVPYSGFPAGNKACMFSGVTGGLAISDPAAANPTSMNIVGQVTMMAWIKPTVKGAWRDIIAHGYDDTGAEVYLRIGDTVDWEGLGNPDTAYYEVGATADASTYNSAIFPMPDGDIGNWVFLAGTWDGANWNLYRNGVLVATAADTVGAVQITNRWSIGARSDPVDPFGMYFGGLIDEPAVFNTALSATTIQNLYQSANVPPVITQGPQLPPGTIFEGDSLTLTVQAEGNPTLKYQWYKGASAIGGQTGTSLPLNNLHISDSGTYSVIVTNNYGSATGSVALTVVGAPPTFVQAPQPATRFTGASATFTTIAGGSTPLTYQWNFGPSSTPIPGATSSSYTVVAGSGTAGQYSCTLSNAYGQPTSPAVTLTVLPQPPGYAAAVLGDGPMAYWRLDEASGSVAHDYVGGLDGQYFAATLGVPGYSPADSDTAVSVDGAFNSYVGNISGTGINFQGTGVSFSIEAWVNGAAGQLDQSAVVAKGTGANGGAANEQFCIDVNGGNWRFFVRDSAGNIAEADATSGPDGTWQHLVGVYDASGLQVILYVNGNVAGSATAPATGPRASNHPVSFGSERSGVGPDYDLSFDGTIDEVAIYPSALNPSQVSAHYSAAYGPNTPPFFARQPSPATNYVTLGATLSAEAAGTVPITYQWKKAGVDIPGATSQSLTIDPLALTDQGNYTVAVTNAVGFKISSAAFLAVLPAPTSPVAIPGLVMHLPFDNSLADTSGHGNSGTAIAISGTASNVTAATYVTGALGKALSYSSDPTTTNDTYVYIGVRPDLQFNSYVNFTVSYWIQEPLNFVGNDLPFFTDTIGSTFGFGYVFAPTFGSASFPGGWAMSIFDSVGNGVGVYGDTGTINDGNWHNLIHVIDRTKGMVTYLDGRVAHYTIPAGGGTSAAAAGDIDNGQPATIGQDPTGVYPQAASAFIDDLGVWHKSLTALEAAAIFMAGSVNQVSFVDAPIRLSVAPGSNGQLVLSWPAGVLQSSAVVNGPYSDVTTAQSPFPVSPTGGQQFYRVRE